ncbi:MAG: CehA/McbA family metallohydrolase [Deltaproteobacteria bacterium]
MPSPVRIVLRRVLFFVVILASGVVAGCGGGGGGSAAPPLPENVTIQVFCGRGVQGTDPGVYSQKRNTAFAYTFSLSAGYKDLQIRLAGDPAPSSGSPVIAQNVMLIATAVPVDERPRFKANTHTHTTRSDGSLSPAEIVSRYHERGYDVLFITDHNEITEEAAPAGMLVLPGEELTPNNSVRHANALFATSVIIPGNRQPAEYLKDVVDSGALAMLNHPVWIIGWSLQDILPLTGVSLIEIYNGSGEMQGYHDTQALWDSLLSLGRLWYGVASDDAHDPMEIGRGWIMIQADGLDQAGIRQGMENGSFYASTGILLCRLDLTNGVVRIESRNGETVDFFGNNGLLLRRVTGPFGEYTVQDSDRYVRVVVTGKNGIKAWTQPLYWAAAP